jgi:hypothetical protein
MRSRCHLHFNQLEAFREFLVSRGWVEEQAKGQYEKLRMRHKREKDPLILHVREGAKEHFTTWGLSEKMASAFLHRRQEPTSAEIASVLHDEQYHLAAAGDHEVSPVAPNLER